MDNVTEPILPKSWYGKKVVVAITGTLECGIVGTLLDTNTVGVLVDRSGDWGQSFLPWTNVEAVSPNE